MALAPAARAEVDPRWRYSLELSPAVALPMGEKQNALGRSVNTGGAAFELRGAFFAPVGEDRQVGGALWWDAVGNVRLHGAMRFISDFGDSPVTTRLELGVVASVLPAFALGPRIAAALSYEIAPGFTLGAELGAAVEFIHFGAVLDASATVAYLF